MSDNEPNKHIEEMADMTFPIDALPNNTNEDIATADEADTNISCYGAVHLNTTTFVQ